MVSGTPYNKCNEQVLLPNSPWTLGPRARGRIFGGREAKWERTEGRPRARRATVGTSTTPSFPLPPFPPSFPSGRRGTRGVFSVVSTKGSEVLAPLTRTSELGSWEMVLAFADGSWGVHTGQGTGFRVLGEGARVLGREHRSWSGPRVLGAGARALRRGHGPWGGRRAVFRGGGVGASCSR